MSEKLMNFFIIDKIDICIEIISLINDILM